MAKKKLPVYFNRSQLAREIKLPLGLIYSLDAAGKIPRDGIDVRGNSLFLTNHAQDILNIISTK